MHFEGVVKLNFTALSLNYIRHRNGGNMSYSGYNEQILGWLDMVISNRGIDAEATLKNCRLIEKYASQVNDEKLLGFSYYYAGETYYVLNDIECLFRYMTKSLGYLERSGQWNLASRAYNLLAITSANRGNAPFAMDYYLSGLSYCIKHNIIDVGCIIHMNIGALYMNFGEYKQAQKCFEESHQLLMKNSNCEGYFSYLTTVYLGLAKCYMYRDLIDKTQMYIEKVRTECMGHLEEMEYVYLLILEARMYQVQEKESERDQRIEQIRQKTNNNFAVMDLFDEFYEYSNMLFNIEKYEDFFQILNMLDELTKQAKIVNLQRRVICLKMKYYKMNKDEQEYLNAAGIYYEMSEIMEKENHYMVSSMLTLRRNLDKETHIRQEIERENMELLKKSETDALTGLSNRSCLNAYAEEAFERAMIQHSMLGVEILDIDFFKQYNDNYGHQAGDECLIRVALEIKNLEKYGKVRVFRYGGDEFVILYENYSREEIQNIMEGLKHSIMELCLEHLFSPAYTTVTISQGACVDIPRKENKVWDFLYSADLQLYRVKECSRNSVAMGDCEQLEFQKKW